MPGRDVTYPFSAVIGENTAKRAIQCLLADDDLHGLLMKGPTGTAKSILARSLSSLTDRKLVDLPVNAGEEDIFGGLDLEATLEGGRPVLKPGILQRADGNILCIDDVNLMDTRMLTAVMECIQVGSVRMERDGVSASYPCRTTVIATMDPAERELPDPIADRFDMCVPFIPEDDVSKRSLVVEQDLEYRDDQEGFRSRFRDKDMETRRTIERARDLIPSVKITRRDVNDIVTICGKVNTVGHRGDIACSRTARTLAALDGSDRIRIRDIREASVICLVHRRRAALSDGKNDADDCSSRETQENRDVPEKTGQDIRVTDHPESRDGEHDLQTCPDALMHTETDEDVSSEHVCPTDVPQARVDPDAMTQMLYDVKADLDEMDRLEAVRLSSITGQIPRTAQGKGRGGRSIGYIYPEGRIRDLAFGATVCAAAPYQTMRRPNGLKIAIEPPDLRENIRTGSISCSFMFAVDVSGSLSNSGRLEEAIDAVKAMLEDGYVRRDRVGYLSFGQRLVDLAVPFTRNVESVFAAMRETKTGGSTPLGEALLVLNRYMSNYVRKNPDEQCYVIMMTDGEADTPVVPGNQPAAEVRRICATIKVPNTQWVIIDNGRRNRLANYARKLAGYLGGRYIDIGDLVG